MTRLRLVFYLAVLLGPLACKSAETGKRHLESLCDQEQVLEQYLDFYWDDVRSHQPEIWAQAISTCTETCPEAVNCGPVRSVASWYAPAPDPTHPPTSRSPR